MRAALSCKMWLIPYYIIQQSGIPVIDWLSGSHRSDRKNRGCWAAEARPTHPYLPLFSGNSQWTYRFGSLGITGKAPGGGDSIRGTKENEYSCGYRHAVSRAPTGQIYSLAKVAEQVTERSPREEKSRLPAAGRIVRQGRRAAATLSEWTECVCIIVIGTGPDRGRIEGAL